MLTQDNAQFHIVLVKGWIHKDGKFLLAKRSSRELQAAGLWSLPGGKIDDETESGVIEKTLAREIMEEVGIKVDNFRFVASGSFKRKDGAHVVGITFLCDYESGEAQALEDTDEVAWFALEELKNFKEAPDYLQREIKNLEIYLTNNNV